MGWEEDGPPEFEDNPEYYNDTPEETQQIEKPDWMYEDWWSDISEIKDPELQEKEIERAEILTEKEEELSKKSDSGEIDDFEFLRQHDELRSEIARNKTRWGIESVGVTYGKLSQVSEEYDSLTTADPKRIDLNDRLDRFVEANPERAKEKVDRMFKEGELSEKAYDDISEKVKHHRK